jgi:hypothetical protein
MYSFGVIMWSVFCKDAPFLYKEEDATFAFNPKFPRFPKATPMAVQQLAWR